MTFAVLRRLKGVSGPIPTRVFHLEMANAESSCRKRFCRRGGTRGLGLGRLVAPMTPGSCGGRNQPDHQLRRLGIAEALVGKRLPALEGDDVGDRSAAQPRSTRPGGVERVDNGLWVGPNSFTYRARQHSQIPEQVGPHRLG